MDGHLSSSKCGVRTKAPKIQRTSRAPRWHGKDDSCFFAVFCEQGSSAAKVMDAIARLPDCAGQSSRHSVRLHTSETGGCSEIAQNSKVTRRQKKHWFLLSKMCTDIHLLASLVEKTVRGCSSGTWMGKRVKLGMSVCSSKTSMILFVKRQWYQNGRKEAEYYLAENDYTFRSSGFEAIKTVILAIWCDFFWINFNRRGDKAPAVQCVDDNRYRLFLVELSSTLDLDFFLHDTLLSHFCAVLETSWFIADHTWTTRFHFCLYFLRCPRMSVTQCDFLRSVPNVNVVRISNTRGRSNYDDTPSRKQSQTHHPACPVVCLSVCRCPSVSLSVCPSDCVCCVLWVGVLCMWWEHDMHALVLKTLVLEQ